MFDAALMTVKHKGKYWSVPTVMNPWPIHARQDLLDAAGIKQVPKTWVELGEVAKLVPRSARMARSSASVNMGCTNWTSGPSSFCFSSSAFS